MMFRLFWGLSIVGLILNCYTVGEAFATFLIVRRRKVNGWYQILSKGGLLDEVLRLCIQVLFALAWTGLLTVPTVARRGGLAVLAGASVCILLMTINSMITRRKVLHVKGPL